MVRNIFTEYFNVDSNLIYIYLIFVDYPCGIEPRRDSRHRTFILQGTSLDRYKYLNNILSDLGYPLPRKFDDFGKEEEID